MSSHRKKRKRRKTKAGGIIHTYQRYDPVRFPGPTQPAPDLISGAFDHMLMYGNRRELTSEELARAIRIDPSQIQGLGPSLDALIAMLEQRKQKILETYETRQVLEKSWVAYADLATIATPPPLLIDRYEHAVNQEQIYDLERLWYAVEDDRSPFARHLVQLIEVLGNKYQIEDLASRYTFVGSEPLEIDHAIEVKEELEKIDELLEQLRQAQENSQIYVIDMDMLSEFADEPDLEQLQNIQRMIEDYVKDLAESQGLDDVSGHFNLTPKAYKVFQGKLLERIFSNLQESKTGRHQGPIEGEGSVEVQQTKAYEFGDSIAHMDLPQTFINSLIRSGTGDSIKLHPDDIEVHKTRNSPKCATAVIMDMSGSMRYEGQYMNVKRMALALDGLIRSEYPGDFVQFIEMYTFGKLCHRSEIINLLPKPVTITDPIVRFKVDMSNPEISEYQLPPHFTNIQHSLQLARQHLSAQDTPNRQVILITDGLPTSHFDQEWLYLLYPPDPSTDDATMREAMRCQQEGICINIFLVPSWSQSEEDIRFAYRLAESTSGRVFFTAGNDLDRFVVCDYVEQKREIIG